MISTVLSIFLLFIIIIFVFSYIYNVKRSKNTFPFPPIIRFIKKVNVRLPDPDDRISIVNMEISTSDNTFTANDGTEISYSLISSLLSDKPLLIKGKTFDELNMILETELPQLHKKIIKVIIDMLKKVALILDIKPNIIKLNNITQGSIKLNLDITSELNNPIQAIKSVEKISKNKHDMTERINMISYGFDPDSVKLLSKRIVESIANEEIEVIIENSFHVVCCVLIKFF